MNSCIRLLLLALPLLSGCTVVSAVDVVAGTAIDVSVGTVKTTGKVIGAVIPDGDDREDDDREDSDS